MRVRSFIRCRRFQVKIWSRNVLIHYYGVDRSLRAMVAGTEQGVVLSEKSFLFHNYKGLILSNSSQDLKLTMILETIYNKSRCICYVFYRLQNVLSHLFILITVIIVLFLFIMFILFEL